MSPTDESRGSTAREIAILAFPGCMGTEVFGLVDFLVVAGHLATNMARGSGAAAPAPPPRIRLVAARPGPITLAGGLPLDAARARGRPDLLVVPGLEVSDFGQWPQRLAALQPELALVRRWHAGGVALASVCVGAFVLAEAGVLDGRRATTAWVFEREFAERYPQVRLDRGAVLCEDGPVLTAGAMTSVFDLGQRIARSVWGERVARAAARLSLMSAPRASQRPYVDSELLPRRAPPLSARVQRWLGERLAERYDLATLAKAFHTSTRTLLRRYRAETGATPLQWLQQARVRQAQRLLEQGRASVAQAMAEVGYEDLATFHRLFVRLVGETPARYRRRVLQGE